MRTSPARGGAHTLPRGALPRGGSRGAATAGARTAVAGRTLVAVGSEGQEGGASVFAALDGWLTPGGKSEAGRAYEEEPEEEEEDDDSTYTVKMRLQSDVYGACLCTAMRGLRDGKHMTVITSWIWVAVSIVLSCTVALELLFDRAGMNLSEMGFSSKFGRASAEDIAGRLQQALNGTKRLDSTARFDKDLIKLCLKQPSYSFSLVIQLVWSSRMLGQFAQVRTLFSVLWSCPVKEMRSFTILEDNGTTTIAGMMPFDALGFGLMLVLPKAVSAILIWWAGCRNLALAEDFLDLIFRAVSLHYVTIIESQVFSCFVAHSKKEWVERVRVIQERTPFFRIFLSWPGEVIKFFFALALLGITIYMYGNSAHVRDLCYKCLNSCPNTCADTGHRCELDSFIGSLLSR